MDERENKDLKALLEENTKLARENHRLLKKIHRSQSWGSFFRLLYWAVILVSIFGAYYFIQPFIDSVRGNVESVQSGINTLENINNFDINSLLGN
ncbi:MAG: hypothetical protein WD003_00190 [Candidatus Paceibacterota bacterium]